MEPHSPQSAPAHSTHGGPDAQGVPLHDFSTNANASGPCPQALSAVQQADAVHYPDPAYTRLRQQLATLHGVQPERVLLMASASEALARLCAAARSLGVQRVWWPRQHFGDVARLSLAHGLQPVDDVAQAEWLWWPWCVWQRDGAAFTAERTRPQHARRAGCPGCAAA